LQYHRASSARNLSEFELDVDALRDCLDGIERPSRAGCPVERAVLRLRGGLDYRQEYGIGSDLGDGLGL
jgi:hypothetical protein